MKEAIGVVLAAMLGFTGFATAAPVFSHMTDGLGNFQITVDDRGDMTTDPANLVADGIFGTVIGMDDGFNDSSPNPEPSPSIPEPSFLLLMGIGLVGLSVSRLSLI